MKTALIAGYTGLVGRHLLDLLLASKNYNKIIALGRRELPIKDDRLVFQIADFDNISLDTKIDDVFCCLGTTMKKAGSREKFRLVDFQYPLNLAIAAKNHGATTFVLVTANGANTKSAFFYNRVKGDVEEAIKRLNFEKYDIVRPSLLLGKRKESRLLEDVGQTLTRALGFIFVGPLKNVRGIESVKVARAMASVANDGKAGQHIHQSRDLQRY